MSTDKRTKSKKEANRLYKKLRHLAKKGNIPVTDALKEGRLFLKEIREAAKKVTEPTARNYIDAELDLAKDLGHELTEIV